MFEIESSEEREHYEGVGDYVHVVTSNLFDIARVFEEPDDALHYAHQILKAIEQVPLLTHDLYWNEYSERHRTTVSAADTRCMITATVRKLRVRRDRCYMLGNE